MGVVIVRARWATTEKSCVAVPAAVPPTVWVAVAVYEPVGTSAMVVVQVPSAATVAVPVRSPPRLTATAAPGSPAPLTTTLRVEVADGTVNCCPAVGAVMVGAAKAVARTVEVARSTVATFAPGSTESRRACTLRDPVSYPRGSRNPVVSCAFTVRSTT